MSSCLICLRDVADGGPYHPHCSVALFGTPVAPAVDVELAKLHTLALAMVGHTSLSGIQRKISLRLDADRNTLQLAVAGGRYILKPQAQTFPSLPENEHVTMNLARLVGLTVPACGLVTLKDGSLAYLVKRFDRSDAAKLRQEDFCQLAGKPPKDKYEGSAELCMRLVARFASEPGIERFKLFRLFMFVWWTGNGDMHLKNFSLLATGSLQALSPVYDLLCTRLVIPDDTLALSVAGKKDKLTSRSWKELAAYASITERARERVVRDFHAAESAAIDLVERSFLPAEMKKHYARLLRARTRSLGA
ncbi:MAG: HipA domain-containing protein [Myxococcota bacterium]